ncbi:MAG: hypothetical protein DRP28_01535 [Thermodesulfobacteriota bacterium]|nr:MAG: hypothetical protein DRP28_01535 [Thermodesulfobacteriota bacterium]
MGGLAWVQEEERNGRKLMQAIMTIILNSLYIASSFFHEKIKVVFLSLLILSKSTPMDISNLHIKVIQWSITSF